MLTRLLGRWIKLPQFTDLFGLEHKIDEAVLRFRVVLDGEPQPSLNKHVLLKIYNNPRVIYLTQAAAMEDLMVNKLHIGWEAIISKDAVASVPDQEENLSTLVYLVEEVPPGWLETEDGKENPAPKQRNYKEEN